MISCHIYNFMYNNITIYKESSSYKEVWENGHLYYILPKHKIGYIKECIYNEGYCNIFDHKGDAVLYLKDSKKNLIKQSINEPYLKEKIK